MAISDLFYTTLFSWPVVTALTIATLINIFILLRAFSQGLCKQGTPSGESFFLFSLVFVLSLAVNYVLLYATYQFHKPELIDFAINHEAKIDENDIEKKHEEFNRKYLDNGYKVIAEDYFVVKQELDLSLCNDRETVKYFTYAYNETNKDNADIVICK